ncbi:MAG: hypothetical protein P8I77_02490 [Bacteroidia bacterium]|nr:hypothetical protein [Bacteroidia bacterium]
MQQIRSQGIIEPLPSQLEEVYGRFLLTNKWSIKRRNCAATLNNRGSQKATIRWLFYDSNIKPEIYPNESLGDTNAMQDHDIKWQFRSPCTQLGLSEIFTFEGNNVNQKP